MALKLEDVIRAKAKENLKLADGGDRKSENAKKQGCPKSDKVEKPINTNKELSKIAGVGHNTIHQFRVINAKKKHKNRGCFRFFFASSIIYH